MTEPWTEIASLKSFSYLFVCFQALGVEVQLRKLTSRLVPRTKTRSLVGLYNSCLPDAQAEMLCRFSQQSSISTDDVPTAHINLSFLGVYGSVHIDENVQEPVEGCESLYPSEGCAWILREDLHRHPQSVKT